MAKIATTYTAGSLNTFVYGVDSYDSTKFGLGSLIKQYNGSTAADKYLGPPSVGFARPVETGAAIPAYLVSSVTWSSNIDWVFMGDGSTAAATRRIQLYEYNRTTSSMTWKGFVTCSFPFAGTQGTYTQVGLRVSYEKYTTGTASASGTAVTGTGTAWSTSKICNGCRIGFGSTDPSSISTWYEISAVGGDTSITLTGSAGTVVDGPYVIEELRIVQAVTNGTTATNGGIFLTKGIKYENFSAGGTAIAAAAATDQAARTNYWIGDAATSTDTAYLGIDLLPRSSWTTHYVCGISSTTNPVFYKFNIRAALTLASGKDTTAFVLKSGAYGALTGTPVQTNNFVIAASHTSLGTTYTNCAFFTTATRFYNTKDVTTIISGDTSWANGISTEVPPGATTTFAATGTLKAPVYQSMIDSFVIPSGGRPYVTRFKSDSSQWDRIWMTGNTLIRQVSADNTNTTPSPSYTIGTFTADSNNGILYLVTTGTTAITNFVYTIPTGADWEFVANATGFTGSKQCVLTPEISTLNIDSFSSVFFNSVKWLGQITGQNLGTPTEPIRVWYRTSGISADTGSWTLLDTSGDLSSLSIANSIQFKFEFKVMGATCLPSGITSLAVMYNDRATDSHYQPSVGNSSITNKYFAWRFATAFGGTVPRLKVRLYNAVTSDLLNQDDSTTQAGTWEKSTDGGSSWSSYNTTDKGNETTYIRYKPISLADNVRVLAVLTQY